MESIGKSKSCHYILGASPQTPEIFEAWRVFNEAQRSILFVALEKRSVALRRRNLARDIQGRVRQ